MRRFLIDFLAAIVFSVPLFVEASPVERSQTGPLFNNGTLKIIQGGRSARLNVEIVGTPEARMQGLMGRERLADGAGMLFVYPASAPREFWMKDTLIPLSIAFISEDFNLIEIRHMAPPADNENPPTYYSKEPARYALEVNRGWFKRNGFGVGAKVKVE